MSVFYFGPLVLLTSSRMSSFLGTSHSYIHHKDRSVWASRGETLADYLDMTRVAWEYSGTVSMTDIGVQLVNNRWQLFTRFKDFHNFCPWDFTVFMNQLKSPKYLQDTSLRPAMLWFTINCSLGFQKFKKKMPHLNLFPILDWQVSQARWTPAAPIKLIMKQQIRISRMMNLILIF